MKKTAIAFSVAALLLGITLLSGSTPEEDMAAMYAITQVYPDSGFIAKTWLPRRESFLYEVGRIDFFGRRLVLGSGDNWKEAFEDLKRQSALQVAPPFER